MTDQCHVHVSAGRVQELMWCLPPVHQAQLAFILQDPVHLLLRAESDLIRVSATSLIGFQVPLSQQVWCSNADAGLL